MKGRLREESGRIHSDGAPVTRGNFRNWELSQAQGVRPQLGVGGLTGRPSPIRRRIWPTNRSSVEPLFHQLIRIPRRVRIRPILDTPRDFQGTQPLSVLRAQNTSQAAKRFAWNLFPPCGLSRSLFVVKSGEVAVRSETQRSAPSQLPRPAEVLPTVGTVEVTVPLRSARNEKNRGRTVHSATAADGHQLVSLTSCPQLFAKFPFATSWRAIVVMATNSGGRNPA